MIKRYRLLQAFAVLTIIVPSIFFSFRVNLLDMFSRRFNTTIINASRVEETYCTNGVCIRNYTFNLPDHETEQKSYRIGFHSTFLSSTVIPPGASAVTRAQDLVKKPPNWYEFQEQQIYKEKEVIVTATAPEGRKKVGMEWPRIFFGPADEIGAIHTIYQLFNVHIYLALALFSIIITVALRASYFKRQTNVPYVYIVITGALIACVDFFYSHVFDSVIFHLGISVGLIENFAKWLWGPAIFFLLFRKTINAMAGSTLYLAAIILTGGANGLTSPIFYAAYPRIVLSVACVVFAVTIANVRKKKYFLLLPTSIVLYDALVINGVIPLISTAYLSPLSMLGWFIWNQLEGINILINFALFGQRQESLIRRLRDISSVDQSLNQTYLDPEYLKELVSALAKGVDANRASILVLENGSPIIARYYNGKTSIIKDGFTPPVFARALQTREEMFLVDQNELITIKSRNHSAKNETTYSNRYSIITPIIEDDRAIGAIAITEINEEKTLLDDKHHQDHLKDLIAIIKADITNRRIRLDREQHIRLRNVQDAIASEFVRKAQKSTELNEVLQHFVDITNNHTELKLVAFKFSEDDASAKCVTSAGLSEEAKHLWSQEVFYAKADNKLSPIAIAVNEKKPVYIDDIRTFFGFLKEKSILALRATSAKGLAVLPLNHFGKTYGVLLVIKPMQVAEDLSIQEYRFLDKCVEVLAHQIYRTEINARFELQEKTLQKIIDPELIEKVLQKRERGEQVVGVVEDNYIFILDFRGSTNASRECNDPLDLAKRLSRIYNKADSMIRSYGGYFEKGNGDGLIFTIRSSAKAASFAVELICDLQRQLETVAQNELGISRSIAIAHYGKLFRGVMGSSDRMAWDNCGTDLVNAFDIEKRAKKVDGAVFAASETFARKLGEENFKKLSEASSGQLLIKEFSEKIYLFDKTSVENLHYSFNINRHPIKRAS